MIRKALLETIHEAAHMQRWNDHIRPPQGFSELDKQAHKMIIAFVVSKFEETDRRQPVDWQALIEGAFFEFLQRIVLTDLKPPVYHRLMAEKGRELNEWVIKQLKNKTEDLKGDFHGKMVSYLMDPEYAPLEKRILKASHYLATNWEFSIIYRFNEGIYGVEQTRQNIENELEEYYDLSGVQKLGLRKKAYNFIDLVGQLRFQKRWAQSPRTPETSVLGHMLIVAILSYLCSLEIDACGMRLCNNFFAGLFHDLPEVLTRDIVSPVKRSIEGLDEIIKKIEERQVEDLLLPLLPVSWRKGFLYYINDEFKSKITENGEIRILSSDDINQSYNRDDLLPVDGEIVKACDNLAAYIEANLSIMHGIRSRHLEDGLAVYAQYENRKIAGLNFGQYFDFFKYKG
jgi:putative hydrolase of HD superfamily